ncbi:large ribosomal subunit protein bL9m-like [Mytilus galloprovincialis]|uniref:Large ribosomal subunit protein bL9m n=1 Tax=Mytilus edulis TaxID=6550 RepID=A0A8S3RXI4_MYTED|nr:MRPL9 [Mytilus edulis]
MQSFVRVGYDACQSVARQMTKTPTFCKLQHIRSTCVFDHENYTPERRRGSNPIFDQKYDVIKLKENKHQISLPDIECLLTKVVDGVGYPGQVVMVKRSIFRNSLLPLGHALYPTPENIAEVQQRLEETGEIRKYKNFTPYTRKFLKEISELHLPIPMNGDTKWQLEKSHVRIALRLLNVEISDEGCIELPEEPVTTPGRLTLGITINNTKSVKFRSTVYLKYKDPVKQRKYPEPQITVWRNEPLEYDELIHSN